MGVQLLEPDTAKACFVAAKRRRDRHLMTNCSPEGASVNLPAVNVEHGATDESPVAPRRATPRTADSPIFLVGTFRSGTTMFWNMLRSSNKYTCYYEPLHESLLLYLEQPPTIPHDPSHLAVNDYFAEYRALSHSEFRTVWRPWFGREHFLALESDSLPELAEYLHFLMSNSARPVVMKFVRAGYRVRWLRAHFPDARLIHIERRPRDIWTSMWGREHSVVGRTTQRLLNQFGTRWARPKFWVYIGMIAADLGIDVDGHPYRTFYALTRLADEMVTPVADQRWQYEAAVGNFDTWCQRELLNTGLLDRPPDALPHRESIGARGHSQRWYDKQEALVDQRLVGPSQASVLRTDSLLLSKWYRPSLAYQDVLRTASSRTASRFRVERSQDIDDVR